jgi:hypothetical protein
MDLVGIEKNGVSYHQFDNNIRSILLKFLQNLAPNWHQQKNQPPEKSLSDWFSMWAQLGSGPSVKN